MFKFKNGISPVIAVILLLAITVVISMSMYSFLQDYTESTISSLGSTNFNSVKVIGVYNDKLFLDSEELELFSLFQIKDLNGNVQCEIRDSKQSTFQGDTRLLMTFDSDTVNSTHVKDLSGYDNHGVINGTIYTEENCISGGCFEFDGVNDYINISKLNNNIEDLTISLWFSPISYGNSFSSEPLNDGNSSLIFGQYIFENGVINNTWIEWRNDGSLETTFYSNYSRIVDLTLNEINKFNQITYTYNFQDKKITFFYNGILVNSTTIENFIFQNESFFIGTGFGNQYGSYYNGFVDELLIYSKELTQEEVLKLHELKSAKFYEQLLTTQTKEINLSNCNLNKNEKYEFIGVLEYGIKISEEFIVK